MPLMILKVSIMSPKAPVLYGWHFQLFKSICDIWNSLPNEVITAKTVNDFEINLDKYWEAQEFKYDHTANINLTSK
jgi:hypothetical protein